MFSLFGCGQHEEFVKNISVSASTAKTTTLAWNPVTTATNGSALAPSDVGYKLYYGKVSKVYTNSIDVGSVTKYTLQNSSFSSGKYYFTVTSYLKSSRLESEKSDEIVVNFP
jgi:hypothetical protein